MGNQRSTSAQLVRSNNATKESAEAVEDTNFSAINNSSRAHNEIRPTANWPNAFSFLTGATVRAFESLTIETNEKTTSDIKVVVKAKPKVKSRLTSGLTNTALNNDVNVPFITGDNHDAA